MNRLLNKILRIYRHAQIRLYTEHTVAKFYRKTYGVKIGENCRIMDRRLGLFGGEPYLIQVGNDVTFAEGIKLITHDGGTGVLRNKYHGINIFGEILIHDNCFIGVSSIILPNVEIGPNSVIGAGSVVTKSVPPNCVVAGVPAKIVCTLAEYEEKALKKGILIDANTYEQKKSIIEKNIERVSGKS